MRAIEKILPAAAIDLIQRVRGAQGFYGDFERFVDRGYNAPLSIKAVPDVLSERDRQILDAFSKITPSPKTVLDVGGADGYVARLLQWAGHDINCTVLETESTCKSHAGNGMKYISKPPTQRFDVVHLSGMLQYLEKPYEMLSSVATLGDWLIVNRIPPYSRDRVTQQKTAEGILFAWFFDRDKMLRAMQSFGEIVSQWDVPDDSPLLDGRRVTYFGVLVHTTNP